MSSSIAFPRGTASSNKKADDNKKKRDSDVLFKDDSSNKRSKISGTESSRSLPVAAGNSGDNKPAKVDMLNFSKYSQGCLVYGYVLKIIANESLGGTNSNIFTGSSALISLPGGMVGSVSYNEVSDYVYNLTQAHHLHIKREKSKSKAEESVPSPASLPDIEKLLSVGQAVRCYVLGLAATATGGAKKTGAADSDRKKKQGIQLSLRSSFINKHLNSNSGSLSVAAETKHGRSKAVKSFKNKFLHTGFPLSGCVSAREDKGYMITCGVSDYTFFLPDSQVPAALLSTESSGDSEGSKASLQLGQMVECVVDNINNDTGVAALRAQRKSVAEAVIPSYNCKLPYAAMAPGMLVEVSVVQVLQNALVVQFLSMFYGVIDCNNLSRPSGLTDGSYKKGDVMTARIVFSNIQTAGSVGAFTGMASLNNTNGASSSSKIDEMLTSNKIIRLSIRPHVLAMKIPDNMPKLGESLSDLKVVQVHKKSGIVLQRVSDLDDAEAAAEEAAADDDEEGTSRKALKQQKKEKMQRDAGMMGVYIPRASLASSLGADDESSDDSDSDSDSDGDAQTGANGVSSISADRLHKVYKTGMVLGGEGADGNMEVRAMGYHYVEGWVVGNNIPSFVNSSIVHFSQIEVGNVFIVTVHDIQEGVGLIVLIGNKVRALCPLLHISDTAPYSGGGGSSAQKLSNMFKEGQRLRMCVWEKSGNSIIMTNKKSIVKVNSATASDGINASAPVSGVDKKPSDSEVITMYTQCMPGVVSWGVVSNISVTHGITVHFYNNVRGVIPTNVLVLQGVDMNSIIAASNAAAKVVLGKSQKSGSKMKLLPTAGASSAAYRIGQVVQTVVVRQEAPSVYLGKAENQRNKGSDGKGSSGGRPFVYLALRVGEAGSIVNKVDSSLPAPRNALVDKENGSGNAPTSTPTAAAPVKTGCVFVSGTVMHYDTKKLCYVMQLDEGAAVRVGHLHRSHLADVALASTAAVYTPGARIENMLMLHSSSNFKDKSKKTAVAFLTLKKLLVTSASEINAESTSSNALPGSISEVTPGQQLVGYIHKICDFGILVRFRNELTALVPRQHLVDSASVNVADLKLEDLFRPSETVRCVVQRVELAKERVIVSLKSALVGAETPGQPGYLASLLQERVRAHDSSLSEYRVGDAVPVTLTEKKEYGHIFMTKQGSTVFLATSGFHCAADPKVPMKVNSDYYVRVLDVDHEMNVINCSVNAGLVDCTTGSVGDSSSSSGKSGKKRKAGDSGKSSRMSSLVEGGKATATVVLVRDQYYVAVCNDGANVGYITVANYNCPYKTTKAGAINGSIYEIGDQVEVSVRSCAPAGPLANTPYSGIAVFALPMGDDQKQRAMLLKAQQRDISAGSAAEVLKERLQVGAVVKLRVDKVSDVEVTVRPIVEEVPLEDESSWKAVTASIPLSCAINQFNSNDVATASQASPFKGLKVGQSIQGKVMQVRSVKATNGEGSGLLVYFGLIAKASGSGSLRPMLNWAGQGRVEAFNVYTGAITSVAATHVMLSLSPYVSAKLNFVDVSSNVNTISEFKDTCRVGQAVTVLVTTVDYNRRQILASRAIIEKRILGFTGKTNAELENGLVVDISAEVVGKKDKKSGSDESGLHSLYACPRRLFKVGSLVPALVYTSVGGAAHRPLNPPALSVLLPNNYYGRICCTEIKDRSSLEDEEESSKWENMSSLVEGYAQSTDAEVDIDDVAVPGTSYKHGDVVLVRVLNGGQDKLASSILSATNPAVHCSVRPSRLISKQAAEEVDELPMEGSLVQGYVVNISQKGCFVRLSREHTGRVLIKDLSDHFVPSPEKVYPVGTLVTARVTSVDAAHNSIILNMRASVIGSNANNNATAMVGSGSEISSDNAVRMQEISTLTVGETVTGVVQKVTDFGVFVVVKHLTSVVGLSRLPNAAPASVTDLSTLYSVGDVVRGKILSVTGAKVSIGLKNSYFDGSASTDEESDEESESEDESEDEDEDSDVVEELYGDVDEGEDDESAMDVDDDDDDDDDDEEGDESEDESEDEVEIDDEVVVKKARRAPREEESEEEESEEDTDDAVAGGRPATSSLFQWGDFAASGKSKKTEENDDDDDDDDEEEEETEKTSRTGTKSKLRTVRAEDEALRRKELDLMADAANTGAPTTVEEFERRLLSQPNDSKLWIQYATHYIGIVDIDSARSVLEKALKVINYRETEAKYNVWVAFLNMEFKYGTGSHLESIFKRAVQHSKGKYVFMHMTRLYAAGDGPDSVQNAMEIFENGLKKYKYSKKFWLEYVVYVLTHNTTEKGASVTANISASKKLYARALLSLEKHKHVFFLTQYAIALYTAAASFLTANCSGADMSSKLTTFNMYVEHGREHFDDCLLKYPKRTDVGNIYIDQEVKLMKTIAGVSTGVAESKKNKGSALTIGSVRSSQATTIRRLFNQALARMNVNVNNIKQTFKKYLDFELQYGTPETQERVKDMARQYVSSKKM